MNTIKRKFVIIILLVIALSGIGFATHIITSMDKDEKILYNNNIKIEENITSSAITTDPPAITTIKEEIPKTNTNTNINQNPPQAYELSDLDLLAKVVYCEAGSDSISDRHQQLVAMVVLNRVKSDRFPNTIADVVYQKGQYSCVGSSRWYKMPNDRAIQNAKLALEGKVSCPTNVVFQAEFKQGSGVYEHIGNTYFCYI